MQYYVLLRQRKPDERPHQQKVTADSAAFGINYVPDFLSASHPAF